MQEYQYLSLEDEVVLDQTFAERPRGGIGSLLRAILEKHQDQDVEFKVHKSFLPRSFFTNPAALVQQVQTGTHQHIKTWREGDIVHFRASNEDFANPRSFIGQLFEKLQALPEEGEGGRLPSLDVTYDDLPESYRQSPARMLPGFRRLLQRCNPNWQVKITTYQNFVRLWLLKDTPPSPSRRQRRSYRAHS